MGVGAPMTLKAPQVAVTIERIIAGERQRIEDQVIVEHPLTLFLNGQELVTLLCTPEHLEPLAVGFLHSEGFIDGMSDIASIRLDEERGAIHVATRRQVFLAEKLFGKRTISTGCGRGSVFYQATDLIKTAPVESALRVPAGAVSLAMRSMQLNSPLFRSTGGTHYAALAESTGQVMVLREDVGRHNAVDKIIGECLIRGWDTEDKFLITTGRISSEMLVKAARMRVPVLVSRSAPTELAVNMADELRVTLVGFARGGRMNIYTHPWRISSE